MKWLEISVSIDSEEATESVCQLFDLYGEGGAVQEQVFGEQEKLGTGGPAPVMVKTYLPLNGRDEDRLQLIQAELSFFFFFFFFFL